MSDLVWSRRNITVPFVDTRAIALLLLRRRAAEANGIAFVLTNETGLTGRARLMEIRSNLSGGYELSSCHVSVIPAAPPTVPL